MIFVAGDRLVYITQGKHVTDVEHVEWSSVLRQDIKQINKKSLIVRNISI